MWRHVHILYNTVHVHCTVLVHGIWRRMGNRRYTSPHKKLASWCLSVLCSIHWQPENPFELHCPKRKSKIPRYTYSNMSFTIFPLHFMLHLGILDYLISRYISWYILEFWITFCSSVQEVTILTNSCPWVQNLVEP